MIATAQSQNSRHYSTIAVHFSGARESAIGLKAANEALLEVGASVEQLEPPRPVDHLQRVSASRPLDAAETAEALDTFKLERDDVLGIVAKSGRVPVLHGERYSLSTSEVGVPPYPKVYDMASMDREAHVAAMFKFGRLHINHVLEDGTGVDETMAVVGGGAFTWFFKHPKDGVMKVELPAVAPGTPGWRVNYPGLTPHGAFLDAEDGFVVAYITGPPVWTMDYGSEEESHNPWVDFQQEVPVLLASPK